MADKPERRQRRTPRQARSRATWEAIVEAAAQILERRGADAFNTNDVAERAGVSIGTLYQYFSDKRALLLAAAKRDLAADGASLPTRQRALVHALIAMLERFGSLGGAAPATPVARHISVRPVTQLKRRRLNPSQEAFDIIVDWLAVLTPAPGPALRPIPIRRHIRE